jgi:hypothetical protein
MSGATLQREDAIAEAHRWAPEPAPEAREDAAPDAVELALHLLRSIAEDPLLRSAACGGEAVSAAAGAADAWGRHRSLM